MITEFSELTPEEVVKAINEMIADGEFPVLEGMSVMSGGGIGQTLPGGSMPFINGQSLAVISRTIIMVPSYDIGSPACPQSVQGFFTTGSPTRFCNGYPVATFSSIGLVTGAAGPPEVHPTEAVFAPIDVHDVVALP